MSMRILHAGLVSTADYALSVRMQDILPSWYCIQNAMADSLQHIMSCNVLAGAMIIWTSVCNSSHAGYNSIQAGDNCLAAKHLRDPYFASRA